MIYSVHSFFNETIPIVYECWVGEYICIGGFAWAQDGRVYACVSALLGW